MRNNKSVENKQKVAVFFNVVVENLEFKCETQVGNNMRSICLKTKTYISTLYTFYEYLNGAELDFARSCAKAGEKTEQFLIGSNKDL